MRKNRKYFLLAPAGAGLMFLGNNLVCRGLLYGRVMEWLGWIVMGFFLAVAGWKFRKIQKSWKDTLFVLALLLAGGFLICCGTVGEVKAGMDAVKGPVTLELQNCRVEHTTSLRRVSSSYYLEGRTFSGEKKRFPITGKRYREFTDRGECIIQVVCWEKSSVLKEIR